MAEPAHEDPLTTALAALLDPPTASQRATAIVRAVGGGHRLRMATDRQLLARAPVSTAEARRITGAFALVAAALAARPPGPLERPEAVARALPALRTSPVEELWLLTVDPGLRPIGRHLIARGGPSTCTADPAVVLRHALLDAAAGAFLAHNHPSGDPTPSPDDRRFTARVRAQLELVGCALHDHLVVAGDALASCDA